MKAIICVIGCYFFMSAENRMILYNSANFGNNNHQSAYLANDSSVAVKANKPFEGKKIADKTVTPEMFGAIGDGQVHKLSTRYTTIEAARKDFPDVKDLDITIDGAAFQKAVDVASKNEGEVIAEKKYDINFPLITRNNVIIDGRNKGYIVNDRSRPKNMNHLAFFFGDHTAQGFNKAGNSSAGYILYDVAGSVSAGQNYVQLANPSDVSSFKTGQLIMVASSYKRKQAEKKILLSYHITICKIIRIEGSKLYFEYPIDEDIPTVQIAANGNYDPLAEINFGGVENVTLRNFTIDAGHLTLATYGYNCHIDNIQILNAIRVIGLNAMTHSTLTNISGTFAWMGIEIKTGSSDVLVRNINASYKAIPGFPHCKDVISLGQYNRNIVIDSFKIDMGTESLKHPLIDVHARKGTVSNGIITCKNQTSPFLKFYNERYVTDAKFGCYANIINNVKFYGSASMKSVMDIGDDENNMNENPNKTKRLVNAKNQNKVPLTQSVDEDGDPSAGNSSFTANIPPTANIVENCVFDGGSQTSYAGLNQGQQNIVRNCVFTKAKLKISPGFHDKNTVSNNKESN